jgi:hypothetical protein
MGEDAKLYRLCLNALERCHNENHAAYKNYGARGIFVCQEWHDIAEFVIGVFNEIGRPRPGESIDRIDNARGYEPGNIRWSSHVGQNRNRRNVVVLDGGLTIPEIAEKLNCTSAAVAYRLKMGWSIERILSTPPRPMKNSKRSRA